MNHQSSKNSKQKNKELVSNEIKHSIIRNKFDLFLLVLSSISFVEVVSIEFNIGWKILSAPVSNITIAFSYSIIGSALFYLINVYIPNISKKKNYYEVIQFKLDEISSIYLNQFHKTILSSGKFKTIDIESLRYFFENGNRNQKMKHINYLLNRIVLLSDEIIAFSSYANPKLINKVVKLRYYSSTVSIKNYIDCEEAEVETLADTYFVFFKPIIDLEESINKIILAKDLIC